MIWFWIRNPDTHRCLVNRLELVIAFSNSDQIEIRRELQSRYAGRVKFEGFRILPSL